MIFVQIPHPPSRAHRGNFTDDVFCSIGNVPTPFRYIADSAPPALRSYNPSEYHLKRPSENPERWRGTTSGLRTQRHGKSAEDNNAFVHQGKVAAGGGTPCHCYCWRVLVHDQSRERGPPRPSSARARPTAVPAATWLESRGRPPSTSAAPSPSSTPSTAFSEGWRPEENQLDTSLARLWEADALAARGVPWVGRKVVRGVCQLMAGTVECHMAYSWLHLRALRTEALNYDGLGREVVRSSALLGLGAFPHPIAPARRSRPGRGVGDGLQG